MAATGIPLSQKAPRRQEFAPLPMPPPLLHARSGNQLHDEPQTPIRMAFTSPLSTPQGSPSKSKLPPGATELPSVFENAMKLTPGSPSKVGRNAHSPNKIGTQPKDEGFEDIDSLQELPAGLGSPSRKSNKENKPTGIRPAKEANYTPNQAAVSRQERYQATETSEPAARGRYNPQRGLTPEELELLQLPKVKRLANVTQLCKVPAPFLFQNLIVFQTFLIIILIS